MSFCDSAAPFGLLLASTLKQGAAFLKSDFSPKSRRPLKLWGRKRQPVVSP